MYESLVLRYVIYIIYYIIGDQLGQKSSIFLLKNEWRNRPISLTKNWIQTKHDSEETLRLIRTMCFEMKDQNRITTIQSTLDAYRQLISYGHWARIYGDPRRDNLNSKSKQVVFLRFPIIMTTENPCDLSQLLSKALKWKPSKTHDFRSYGVEVIAPLPDPVCPQSKGLYAEGRVTWWLFCIFSKSK